MEYGGNMDKNRKSELIKTYAIHEGDTGSPEVQIGTFDWTY